MLPWFVSQLWYNQMSYICALPEGVRRLRCVNAGGEQLCLCGLLIWTPDGEQSWPSSQFVIKIVQSLWSPCWAPVLLPPHSTSPPFKLSKMSICSPFSHLPLQLSAQGQRSTALSQVHAGTAATGFTHRQQQLQVFFFILLPSTLQLKFSLRSWSEEDTV